MESTSRIAQDFINNPTEELKQLMSDPQTTTESRAALSSVAAPGSHFTRLSRDGSKGASQLGNGRLQVVNEHQEFSKQLSPYLDKWGLLDKGFAYDVVAVFGSQSTGKSTLLNRLFGTTFDVMDESKRQQTTKGIWMCPSAYTSTLVMDVEGTDGRERGEDQDFERKSALFSLASTEVLLVNLWEHQIGLYQGANMGLLKTVFEVNLGLFGGSDGKAQSKEKTLILFVIRDHVGSTPMTNLTGTLKADMEKIWASLSKPAHLIDAKLDQYFDLSFSALPHKILMPEKFEEAVVDLRKRFTDRSRADYVFQPSYHKRIPADGVSFYMENIWQQVLTNKDLDLPTQQELLAQFRCDEIAAAATEVFLASSKAIRRPVDAGSVVEGLGALMRDWLDVALALHTSLSPLFIGQIKNLHKSASTSFSKEIQAGLKESGYDFAQVVAKARSGAREGFITAAKEARMNDSEWEYDHELALLDGDLDHIANQSRSDETRKMVNAIERQVKKQLLEPVEVALSKPEPSMWDTVLTTYRDVSQSAESSYLAKAKGFGCTDEENEAALTVLRTRTWLTLHRKLEEQTSDANLISILRSTFEERFRYDDIGVPRVWKPEDDLEGAFRKAKDETLALLPLFAKIESDHMPNIPPPPDNEEDATPFDPSTAFTLLTPTKLLGLESRFKREADAAYVEAKRSMVSSIAQIPVWMYGALAVLGWNEAMAVLFNPLYFAMLLVLAASGYIILQLGLAGPILQMSRTLFNEVRKIAADKMREAFKEEPRMTEPVEARNGSREGDLLRNKLQEK